MPKIINTIETFRVVAVSDNTNSFGLQQHILVSKAGTVFKACINPQFAKKKGEDVIVPVTVNGLNATHTFASVGYEIPERMENAPKEIINEIFKSK